MPEPDVGPFFPLQIVIDTDGIDWTHFKGVMDHLLVFTQLPEPLKKKTRALIELLTQKGYARLRLERKADCQDAVVSIDESPVSIADMPESHFNTLKLLAWYLEWHRRRTMSQLRKVADKRKGEKQKGHTWPCINCDEEVPHSKNYCGNPDCASWNISYVVTGIAVLQPLEEAQSA
jgi:hypothetical protein